MFLNRISFKLSLVVLFVCFYISLYFPFFSNFFINAFKADTFDYFALALKIFKGELPVENMPIDLPFGYPLILSFFIGLGAKYVILLQIFLNLVGSLLLIVESSRLSKEYFISVFIGLMIYNFIPYTFQHNTMILTESFFTGVLRGAPASSQFGISSFSAFGSNTFPESI